jgi:CheY-like chemotaxis protein
VGKIVFCEDDATIQKLIRAALRGTPHEVHMASDGEEGLALIRRERPDVVFSDVSMPRVDGYQLGDALKSSPETAAIPIIFMTASVQRAQIEDAMQHGAAGVLRKPFTMAELRERVAEFASAES